MTQFAVEVDKTVVLKTAPEQPFEVTLRSPGPSGYEWTPKFDASKLRLIKKRRRPASRTSFGASGSDVFRFQPLSRGAVNLIFDLARPWESEPVDQREYRIEVG